MKYIVTLLLAVGLACASVDINSADAKTLSTLDGIGASKAEAIVKYRQKNGCFSSVDELEKVKGIGEKTVTKNKKNLKAGKCKK